MNVKLNTTFVKYAVTALIAMSVGLGLAGGNKPADVPNAPTRAERQELAQVEKMNPTGLSCWLDYQQQSATYTVSCETTDK